MFYRIETYYANRICGVRRKAHCGNQTGHIMVKYNLNESPDYLHTPKYRGSIQHWFTEKGWNEIGCKIVNEYKGSCRIK